MVHILPIGDLKEHEENTTCDCCPQVIFDEYEIIVIHNSYYEREKKET